jgi:hypothetical protein
LRRSSSGRLTRIDPFSSTNRPKTMNMHGFDSLNFLTRLAAG